MRNIFITVLNIIIPKWEDIYLKYKKKHFST